MDDDSADVADPDDGDDTELEASQLERRDLTEPSLTACDVCGRDVGDGQRTADTTLCPWCCRGERRPDCA